MKINLSKKIYATIEFYSKQKLNRKEPIIIGLMTKDILQEIKDKLQGFNGLELE